MTLEDVCCIGPTIKLEVRVLFVCSCTCRLLKCAICNVGMFQPPPPPRDVDRRRPKNDFDDYDGNYKRGRF